MIANSSTPSLAQGAATPAARTKPEEPDSQFLKEARVRRVLLVFHLRGGQRISGTVRAFGRYSVDVQTAAGRRS